MNILEYKKMSEIEESHFWYIGMRALTETLLNKFLKNKNNKILDAGCGTGRNLLLLKKYGDAVGIDISQRVIQLGKQKGILNIKKASINETKYPDNSFDLVTCFDVLGHEKINEKKTLNEIYRILKPNGLLLLRVASYKWLFSYHDILVHNKRRYLKKEIVEKLTRKKLIPIKTTYANTFLFPLITVKRLFYKLFNLKGRNSDTNHMPFLFNSIYLLILLVESILIKYINLPFGVSIIVVAKKI